MQAARVQLTLMHKVALACPAAATFVGFMDQLLQQYRSLTPSGRMLMLVVHFSSACISVQVQWLLAWPTVTYCMQPPSALL